MAVLQIRSGLDTIPNDIKDKIIAPKISGLTKPGVPDMSPERRYLLNAFILNFKLALTLTNKHRQLAFNIIRKAEDAFEEYCCAANSLKDYVTARGLTVSHYFSALRHFEHCLAHLYQATRCMNALASTWGEDKQFESHDGSILERVCIIHNAIKHMDGRFERGILGDDNSFALFASNATSTIPDGDPAGTANVLLWLTDDGLECAEATITYAELVQEVRELYREAENLTRMTPEADKTTPYRSAI